MKSFSAKAHDLYEEIGRVLAPEDRESFMPDLTPDIEPEKPARERELEAVSKSLASKYCDLVETGERLSFTTCSYLRWQRTIKNSFISTRA